MTVIWTMLKMNMKLLLRNAGYLCFLIILPVAATLLLNLTLAFDPAVFDPSNIESRIIYLNNDKQRIDSIEGEQLNIKVYDFAVSELSDNLLEYLQNTGMFRIYCFMNADGNLEDTEKEALDAMNRNTISSVMIIRNGEKISNSIEIFYGHEDIRINYFVEIVNNYMALYENAMILSNSNEQKALDIIASAVDSMPALSDDNFTSDISRLDSINQTQKASTMFSWGLVSLAFAISGVFVSNLLIMERNNGTLKRIRLSDISLSSYLLVKLLMAIFTVIIQIAFMGIGIWAFVRVDFGITMLQYLGITFGFALVFNILSLVVGILANNLLTTSYVAFCAGSMLPLIAGLYFPGVTLKGWMASVSMIAPQRWSVIALDTLLAGDKGAYGNYILVIIAFLAVLGCVGVLGLKGIHKEA